MTGQAKDSPLFFLPNPKNPGIEKIFPPYALPALSSSATKKEYGIFHSNGISAPYYIARAANERAIVIGCSGLNTQNLINDHELRRLNHVGITIVWMSLPKLSGPMMKRYQHLAEQFFTNKHSPARILLPYDKPRYALTHSTGGQLFMHLMHQPGIQKKISALFSGVVYVAPYFDSAGASLRHAPRLSSKAFQWYFHKNADKRPQDTLIGNLYIQMEAWCESRNYHTPKDMDFEVSSTCGQILELQTEGQKLQNTFNPLAAAKIPSIFVIGDHDKYACPQTSVELAQKMGAEILIAKGGYHDPLRTHPHLVDHFIGKVEECIRQHEEKRARLAVPSTKTPGHGDDRADDDDDLFKDGLLTRLSYRAGAALQSGARFLNAAAGLF